MASVRQYVFALRFLVPGIISILCGLFFLTSPNDMMLGVGAIALGIACTAIGVWLLKLIRSEPTNIPPPTLQNSPQKIPQIQIPQIQVPQIKVPQPGVPQVVVPPQRVVPPAKPVPQGSVPQGQPLPRPAAPKPPPAKQTPVVEFPQIQVTPTKKAK